jgi:acyl-CoA synthetase (NDP forming)
VIPARAAGTLAAALFRPRAVALIGASADPAKNNSRAQRLLRRMGFAGRVVPINPAHAEIMGEPAFADVRLAPGPIDHAFVMVPARAVADAVAGCADAGVPVATIFSAGFAELGAEGAAMQARVVAIAREGGVRLLGPNCMGLINVADGVPLTVNAAFEAEALRPGWLSLISQSGSMMGALMTRLHARGLGFAKMVSVGNECDIAVGELAELLVEDPATRVLLLFLEAFRDAPRLAAAARRAHALGKPVIALKLGRSETGRLLAASHTGAMLGEDAVSAAFFRDHGILRVDTLEGLLELPRLVLGRRPPAGRRVAAVTGTGGAAALVLDRLGSLGDEVVGPPAALRAALAGAGIDLPEAPLIDLPMGGTPRQYRTALTALLQGGIGDAVLAVLGSSARLRPEQIDDTILAADRTGAPPLAVFIAPLAEAALQRLDAAGVAAFRTPESCADALHAYLTWQAPREPPVRSPALIGQARAALAGQGPGALDEAASYRLFAAIGIETPAHQVVRDPQAIEVGAAPVAVKLLSPDIAHKTEAGLVRLNLSGRAAAVAAAAALLARTVALRPAVRVNGVLVAPMQRGLMEVILGFRRDPAIGPVVMLGAGGVAAELRRSVSLRLAPVDEAEAAAMIAEVPELRLLAGFRGLPRGDLAALARAVSALSLLAGLAEPAIAEAEINPLLVRAEGDGAVAVDGLVVLAPPPPPPGEGSR